MLLPLLQQKDAQIVKRATQFGKILRLFRKVVGQSFTQRQRLLVVPESSRDVVPVGDGQRVIGIGQKTSGSGVLQVRLQNALAQPHRVVIAIGAEVSLCQTYPHLQAVAAGVPKLFKQFDRLRIRRFGFLCLSQLGANDADPIVGRRQLNQ